MHGDAAGVVSTLIIKKSLSGDTGGSAEVSEYLRECLE
jgi:hypothetical protein